LVGGSNPSLATNLPRRIPVTSVTVYAGNRLDAANAVTLAHLRAPAFEIAHFHSSRRAETDVRLRQ
jgi:hypothetical protein